MPNSEATTNVGSHKIKSKRFAKTKTKLAKLNTLTVLHMGSYLTTLQSTIGKELFHANKKKSHKNEAQFGSEPTYSSEVVHVRMHVMKISVQLIGIGQYEN